MKKVAGLSTGVEPVSIESQSIILPLNYDNQLDTELNKIKIIPVAGCLYKLPVELAKLVV